MLILIVQPVSGAHFNPVVTLADRTLGASCSVGTIVAYVAAQVIGGIGGGMLANAMFGAATALSTTERATAGHLFGEVVATAGLILLIFALVRTGRAALVGPAVGAYVGAAYWFTSSTSFANPAVTAGRIFTDTFAGITPATAWPFLGAQFVGAAVGSRRRTLELAREYGATDVVDYKAGSTLDQVLALTDGEPVDAVLVASGGSVSDKFTTALRLVKPGGYVANVSIFFDDQNVTIPMDVWAQGGMEKFLTGVFVKEGREFYTRPLRLMAHGRLDTSPFVTHTLTGWDRLEEALDLMRPRNPDVIKPIITTLESVASNTRKRYA